MKNKKFAKAWLKRAESNFQLAKIGKKSKNIYYDDLCFNCQQAAEKALKALLISIDKEFPFIHSISRFLELIEEENIKIPNEVKKAIELTDYAVKSRYFGDYESVTEEEYSEALEITEELIKWVKSQMEELK